MNAKEKKVEMPRIDMGMGAGAAEKNLYSADEAMNFLEPRIRAMFS